MKTVRQALRPRPRRKNAITANSGETFNAKRKSPAVIFEKTGERYKALNEMKNTTAKESTTTTSKAQISKKKIFETARQYAGSGLCVIPIRADGSKRPALDAWKEFEQRTPNADELQRWFGRQQRIGLGIVCGQVSGNLEVIDIDDTEIANAFLEALNEYEPGLAADLVIVKTPRDGAHIVYRCERIEGNQHLALREAELGDIGDDEAKRLKAYRRGDGQWCKKKVLIETRGEGGYIIAVGSHADCHPAKKPYELISGSLETIPTLMPDARRILFSLARSFNEYVSADRQQATPELKHDMKPGEDFNQRGDVRALLEKHGWKRCGQVHNGERWIRPNGDRPSATLFDGGCFYNFSSNVAGLEADRAYSPFALLAALDHNGDYHAAAKALHQQGYGKAPETKAEKGTGNAAKTEGNEEWEAPAPLFHYDLPDFPVSSLPSWLRAFVESLACATQTPVDMAALMSLAVCSAAVARNVVVTARKGWEEPLNIFIAIALPPANRKSQVVSDVTRPLYDYERELSLSARERIAAERSAYNILVQELAELEKKCARADIADRDGLRELAQAKARELAARKMPVMPKMIVDDVTAEVLASILAEQAGRIAMFSAEGGIFDTLAGRYSNGTPNIDVLLKGHSGDDLRVDRRDRSEHIEKPALTIGLAVQPDVLRGLIEKPGFRGRGLIGRFLYSLPKSTVGQRKIRPTAMTESIRHVYGKNVCRLAVIEAFSNIDGKMEPRLLRFSKEADDLLASFEEEIEPMLGSEGELSYIGDWGGKLAGATVRIAAILHLAQHAESLSQQWPGEVSADTLKDAIAIARYLVAHARVAYAEMAADQKIEDAKFVLRWIEKTGSTTFSKRNAFTEMKSRFKQVASIEPALKVLEDHNYIQMEEIPSEKRAGRKSSPIFLVNPFVTASLPAPPPH